MAGQPDIPGAGTHGGASQAAAATRPFALHIAK
jgi:hypothetical protein